MNLLYLYFQNRTRTRTYCQFGNVVSVSLAHRTPCHPATRAAGGGHINAATGIGGAVGFLLPWRYLTNGCKRVYTKSSCIVYRVSCIVYTYTYEYTKFK